MGEKSYGKYKQLGVYLVVAIGLYIGIRCLFTAAFPFFVAFIFLQIFYPAAVVIKKKTRIGKGISVFVLFLMVLALAGVLLWFLLGTLFHQIGEVFANLDIYEAYVIDFFEKCCCRLEEFTGLKAEYVKPYLLGNFYNALDSLQESMGQEVVFASYGYAKSIVKVIVVLVVTLAITVLLAKDYDQILGQLMKNPFWENLKQIKEKVFHALLIYLRAQLVIVMVVSAVCCITFWAIGTGKSLLLGCLIGVLDALPFIGTGAVLIPWVIFSLFQGDVLKAAILGTLYLACTFIREFLEPKLIGSKLGVLPVYVVASIYAGLVLYGFMGVILGPLQALLTREIARQWIQEHSS